MAIFLIIALLCSCKNTGKDKNTSNSPISSENSVTTESTVPATPTPTPLPTETPTPTPTPEPTPTEIKISFIGDTTLGEQRVHMGQSYCFTSVVGDNFSYPFSKALPYLEADDMTLCNLEGPLTSSNNLRPEREIYLKGDPK
ncbi:MAG: CapA family protein, partial [Clostridiales bacterium]|nr:CapA family protein [Clostridiales bacterium]